MNNRIHIYEIKPDVNDVKLVEIPPVDFRM